MTPDPSADAKTILRLLIDNEEAVAELYRAYAARFVTVQALWAELAAEEKSHAAQIRTLAKILPTDLPGAGSQFDPARIGESVNRAMNETARALSAEMTLHDALCVAIEIENGMIEKGFFEIFDNQGEQAQSTFRGLRGLTENHRRRLTEFAASHGFEIDSK